MLEGFLGAKTGGFVSAEFVCLSACSPVAQKEKRERESKRGLEVYVHVGVDVEAMKQSYIHRIYSPPWHGSRWCSSCRG